MGMQICRCYTILLPGLLFLPEPGSPEFHRVRLPVQSPRLLGMSMDAEGDIWLGSTHRRLYRYRPQTGVIEEIGLPFDSSISQTLCVGRKVYLLGQSYPKLMIYDRTARMGLKTVLLTMNCDTVAQMSCDSTS
jgi:sugar lactone lactonase YvrE